MKRTREGKEEEERRTEKEKKKRMRFRAAPYNFFVCSRAQHGVRFFVVTFLTKWKKIHIYIFLYTRDQLFKFYV